MADKYKLPKDIKEKLADAVDLWARYNLDGKPAILANEMYCSLESTMIGKTKEMNDKF